MNDSALKSFCTWARTELIKGVEAQMVRYGVTEPVPSPVGSETVNGLPLSPAEVVQRDELLRIQTEVGHEALRDRAAYTWFNRLCAIRILQKNNLCSPVLTYADAARTPFAPGHDRRRS